MKSKALLFLLLIITIGLGVALYMRHDKAVQEEQKATAAIQELSNQWIHVKEDLNEQQRVNSSLMTNLDIREERLVKYSNDLASIETTLTKTRAEAKAAADAAQAEVAKRDARISELEGQKDDLTKKMTDLTGEITSLEGRIGETQRKLAASEGDRASLLKELKQLQQEKAELEKRFNDLSQLRDQVHKLKEELSIARRLEWIRRGLYGSSKGAELMQNGPTAPLPPRTNYNLNVEVQQDGKARVLPGRENAPTNAPAPK